MSDLFVQQAALASGTTTASVTLTGVVAGNVIAVVGTVGNNATPTLHSVSDGTAYTAGNSASDATDTVYAQGFYLKNAGAGSHTVVFTSDTGAQCDMFVAEIGTTAGASVAVDTKANFQAVPGNGANAIVSGALTIGAASTVWGVICTSSNAGGGASSAQVGTAPFTFTSRQSGQGTGCGDYRVESAPAAANGSATGTVAGGFGSASYLTVAIAIANAAGAAVGASLMGAISL